ncbi:MAG: TonB-dependent receptor [Opitutaceae bacterium]
MASASMRFLIPTIIIFQPIGIRAQESSGGNASPQVASQDSAKTSEAITSTKDEVNLVKDGSVADSLKRRPDLRFGNVTVDGEKSQVSLSSMSSAGVEAVEVLKAITPDVDADSIGGSVSVRSKPAYDQGERTLQGSVTFDYASLFDTWNPSASVTFGEVLGANRNLGYLFTVNGGDDTHGFDRLFHQWGPSPVEGGDFAFIDETYFSQLKEEVVSLELTGAVDFRLNEVFSFFVKGNYQDSTGDLFMPRYRQRFGAGNVESASADSAVVRDASVKRDIVDDEWKYHLYSVAAGGYAKTKDIDLDYRLSYETSGSDEEDFFTLDFRADGVDLSYDRNDRQFPEFAATGDQKIDDPSIFLFEDMMRQVWRQSQSDLIGTVNLKVKHGLGTAGTGFWKVGAKARSRDVDQLADSRIYDGFDGDFSLADVVAPYGDDKVFEGRYRLGPMAGPSQSRAFIDQNSDRFVYNVNRSREESDPATYNASELITAAYGMGSYETGPLRFIAGVRLEKTSIDYLGREVVFGEDGDYEGTNEQTGSSSYTNVFPGLHARYRWGDRLTVIGSYTQSIQRAPYSQIVPYRLVYREDLFVEEGNPGLDPTLYDNFDLAFDFNLPADGLLSIELYSKKLHNVVYPSTFLLVDGPYAGFERRRLENGPDGTIQGLQVTWSQGLGAVSEFLEPISFNANLILQNSEIEFDERPDEKLSITRIPGEEFSLTLVYERAWFFGQVELKHVSDMLLYVGDTAAFDHRGYPTDVVNLAMSFQLSKGIRLIAEIDNLTGEPPSYSQGGPQPYSYEGDEDRPYQHLQNTWVGRLGVRFEL